MKYWGRIMKKYSEKINSFIAENVKGMTTKELAMFVNARFGTGFTEAKMKSYKANHKLRNGMPCGLPAERPTELYPEEIRKFITDNHIGTGPIDMAEVLNNTYRASYTKTQMKSYYGNHNVDSGLDGKFEKGCIPANKGRKGVDGWEPTQFKPGHRPYNSMPVGAERVSSESYVDIKIAEPNKWKAKHLIVFEEQRGPIPKGYKVLFGDGDNRNFNINNLILVTNQQLLELNRSKLIQNDADLTRTGVVIADIKIKMAKLRKATRK